MEEAVSILIALVPGEHARAVLGWLYIASSVLAVVRWCLVKWAPGFAANPWTQAFDTVAQLVTQSSKRLADHDKLKKDKP